MRPHDPLNRAHRTFWALALVAVAAAGSLSAALDAPAGTVTALRLALSGVALIVTIALSARVLIVLERARRQAPGTRPKE